MDATAWVGLAGALGGVSITGLIGLGTAALSRRWSASDRRQEREDVRATLRRDAYVRYLIACDALETSVLAVILDANWREAQGASGATQLLVAHRKADPTAWNEMDAARVSAEILAGNAVRDAIERHFDEFVESLRSLSHQDPAGLVMSPPESRPLMDAIRAELAADVGVQAAPTNLPADAAK